MWRIHQIHHIEEVYRATLPPKTTKFSKRTTILGQIYIDLRNMIDDPGARFCNRAHFPVTSSCSTHMDSQSSDTR